MKKHVDEYSDADLYYMLKSEKAVAEKAFGELYRRYSSRVYGYCKRFLRVEQEAQDIFQETFVKFYQSADNRDRDMTNVPAFLLRIARNLCVNSIRKDKSSVQYEDWMVGNSNHTQDKDELLSLIKDAINKLPEEYKDVFILREYEGFSYGEIADLTEQPLSTVKIRIFRAKKRIREILQPYLNDLIKNE